MLADPRQMALWMLAVTVIGLLIVAQGVQNGVEKVTKPMMLILFILMLVLAIRSITLPGAGEGLKFYLVPDFSQWKGTEIFNVIFAAMGQAFFTLSLGIAALTIVGDGDRTRYLRCDHGRTDHLSGVLCLRCENGSGPRTDFYCTAEGVCQDEGRPFLGNAVLPVHGICIPVDGDRGV